MADVFYCFVAVVYHVGMLIYLFSRHENFLFVCSLMADVIHCIFITIYTTEFTWYSSLISFSLAFTGV